MIDLPEKSKKSSTNVWTDDLGWHALPGLVALFLRHGRFNLRFTSSRLGGRVLATLLRRVGVLSAPAEEVQRTRHGEHLDDSESLVYLMFSLINDFTDEFMVSQNRMISGLPCPDPKVGPDRLVNSLRGEVGQTTYSLMAFLVFARHWHQSHEIPSGRLVILSPSSILANSVPLGWAGEDVEFRYSWSVRHSLVFQILRTSWILLSMGLRKRRNIVPGPPMIAVEFAWGLDQSLRLDDLFWWRESGVPADRVLLYFDRADAIATREVISTAEKLGIQCVVKHPRAAGDSPHLQWRSRPGLILSFNRFFRGLQLFSWGVGRAQARNWAATRLLSTLFHASDNSDFFKDFGVSAVIHHHEAGQDDVSLACDIAGAARIGTHWSHHPFPVASQPRLHQVYFAWGPHHVSILEAGHSQSDHILISGCTINGANGEPVPTLTDQRVTKTDNQGQGDRVLALLDQAAPLENFYRFFLNRILDDPRWSLIIKPKNTKDGIPLPVTESPDLLTIYNQAMAAGRVRTLDHHIPPAEASAAADFSIGLSNMSATVMAALSNNRAIHLDYPQLHSSPLSEWAKLFRAGPNQIVFDDPDKLWESLNRFFDEPGSEPKLGLASDEVLNDIDSFRDGLGKKRIGEYLYWYLEGLDKGLDRDSALVTADSRYAEKWGKEMLVRGGSVTSDETNSNHSAHEQGQTIGTSR